MSEVDIFHFEMIPKQVQDIIDSGVESGVYEHYHVKRDDYVRVLNTNDGSIITYDGELIRLTYPLHNEEKFCVELYPPDNVRVVCSTINDKPVGIISLIKRGRIVTIDSYGDEDGPSVLFDENVYAKHINFTWKGEDVINAIVHSTDWSKIEYFVNEAYEPSGKEKQYLHPHILSEHDGDKHRWLFQISDTKKLAFVYDENDLKIYCY